MTRLVYICGLGRSGSTLLDVVLGQHPAAASLGEFDLHLREGWGTNRYCACGKATVECPFWNDVLDHWRRTAGEESTRSYFELEPHYRRTRHWPVLLKQRLMRSPRFDRFCQLTLSLYSSISAVAGCSTLVDSSKTPARALALSQVSELDFRMIHLVRDVRGMIWSHCRPSPGDDRPPRISPLRTLALSSSWILGNLQTEVVRKMIPAEQSTRLTYEQLVSSPVDSESILSRVTGEDYAPVLTSLGRGESAKVGHLAGGNRLRMSRDVRLSPDLVWHQKLPAGARRMSWLLCRPLLRRYGYEPRALIQAAS